MKKFNVTPITNSAEYYVKRGTFQFLQDAYGEGLAAVIISLIGPGYDPAVVYVMSGAINSGTYPAYNVTAGYVFYAGEFYQVDAATFTATGVNVALFSISTTQYTTDADPVTLSDSTVVNIHNIRKMLISQGAPGSTIADLTQGFYLSFVIPQQLNLTTPTTPAMYADNVAVLVGAYPNFGIYVPNPPTNTHPVLLCGSYNVGDIGGGGGGDFSVTFANVGTANYHISWTIISNGTASDDGYLYTPNFRSKTATSFIVHFREPGPVVQNIALEYALIKIS